MTLHTFFSFVVMATDLTSGGNVRETETLVEYLINNHSVNEYTKAYLHTLFETDVVKNIIQSILQFNNEHPDNFTKLVSTEQPQPQTQATDEPKIILVDSPHPPPPSRIRSFFKRLFCCCCDTCFFDLFDDFDAVIHAGISSDERDKLLTNSHRQNVK